MFQVFNKFGQLLVQNGTVDATSAYTLILPNESDGTFQRFICKNDETGAAILVPADLPETNATLNICKFVKNTDDGLYYELICRNGSDGLPYLTLSDQGYA
jgi:hypothetical protein